MLVFLTRSLQIGPFVRWSRRSVESFVGLWSFFGPHSPETPQNDSTLHPGAAGNPSRGAQRRGLPRPGRCRGTQVDVGPRREGLGRGAAAPHSGRLASRPARPRQTERAGPATSGADRSLLSHESQFPGQAGVAIPCQGGSQSRSHSQWNLTASPSWVRGLSRGRIFLDRSCGPRRAVEIPLKARPVITRVKSSSVVNGSGLAGSVGPYASTAGRNQGKDISLGPG